MKSNEPEWHRHGCYNRPARSNTVDVPVKFERRVPAYRCEEGVVTHEVIHLTKRIPFVMSKDCRHDKRATDPSCAGCKWI